MSRPKATVVFPLHASMPFIDIVSANIDRLPEEDIEIIVSDRTQRDGAIGALRERHGDDARITWISTSENLDWIDHYNDLLRRGHGTYMCWMPHDDDFPTGYVMKLVEALEANPEALIACGPVRNVQWDGDSPATPTLSWTWSNEVQQLPVRLGEMSRGREALELARRWPIQVAFRGVFRRETIVARDLFLRRLAGDHMTDVLWCVTVVAMGSMIYISDLWCVKRFHSTSTHRQWPRPSLAETLFIVPRYCLMLWRVRLPWRDALPALLYSTRLTGWYLLRRDVRVASQRQHRQS